MVPVDSDRISRVPPYSGYHSLLSYYVYGAITRYGPTFQTVLLLINSIHVVLQPQLCRNIAGLGFFHFARHYLGNHYCFLLLRVLRCFSSPGLLSFRNATPSTWPWVDHKVSRLALLTMRPIQTRFRFGLRTLSS